MKYHLFDGEINPENTKELINFLNENEQSKVFLASNGGAVYLEEPLVEILNEKCSELVACGNLGSAAFSIFFKTSCPKRITSSVEGTYHLPRRKADLTSNKKIFYDDDRFWIKELYADHDAEIEFCKKIGMTKKEINKIEKAEDVFFSSKRLKELLTYQNEKNN